MIFGFSHMECFGWMLLLEFLHSYDACIAMLIRWAVVRFNDHIHSDGQATVIGECISDFLSHQGSDSLSFLLSLECFAFFGQCACEYIHVEMRAPVGLLWKCLHHQFTFEHSVSFCVASSLQATCAVTKVDAHQVCFFQPWRNFSIAFVLPCCKQI